MELLLPTNNQDHAIDIQNIPTDPIYPDIIGNMILNKLINNAIRESHNAHLDNHIGNFIFDSMLEQVSPILAQLNMTYEYEDINPQDNDIPIFYNTLSSGVKNTWTEIIEPNGSSIDRDASSQVNYHINTEGNNIIKSNAIISISIAENVKERGSYQARERYSRMAMRNSAVISEDNPVRKTQIEVIVKEKKPRPPVVIDVLSHDIANIDEDNNHYEVPDAEELRKIIIEGQIKKTIEVRKKIETEIKEKIEIQKDKKPKKLIDTSKLTFDNNGNIITMKPIKADTLASEFYWSKLNIKNIHTEENKPFKSIDMGSLSPRRTINTKRSTVVVISNPNCVDPFKMVQMPKEEIIAPAGSNFDIISPEIGVRISENKKIKGGNKEFGKHFKKISSDDYSKILTEHIPSMNHSLIKSKLGTQDFNNTVTESSLIMNNSSIVSGMMLPSHKKSVSQVNPLIFSSDKVNTYSNYDSSSMNNTALPYIKGKIFDSSISDFDNSNIKVNSNLKMSSVKMALDSLEDISEMNFLNRVNNNNSHAQLNIFKNRLISPAKATSHEEINKFNINILKSQNWGKTKFNSSSNKTFIKPLSKGNVVRELGINIVNAKPPRSRIHFHGKYIKTDN